MENTYGRACRLRFSGGQRHVYVRDGENCEFSIRSWDGGWWKWWKTLMKSLYSRKINNFHGWKFEKKHENVSKIASEKFLGLENNLFGSVFYVGSDGDTHFAQKWVKWLKIVVFDQRKSFKNSVSNQNRRPHISSHPPTCRSIFATSSSCFARANVSDLSGLASLAS